MFIINKTLSNLLSPKNIWQ